MCDRAATLVLFGFTIVAFALSGCEVSVDDAAESRKPPKPVSTMTLRRSSPGTARFTAATIVPWKAERIGFELAGRVVEVIEPNEPVVANSPTQAGTVLARLDEQPMKIAVESAKADVEVARRRVETNRIAIEQRLPADVATAEADLRLAKLELERSQKLGTAISRSELDLARTRASTAQLQVARAKAALTQAKADQRTLEAQVQLAQQRLVEAQRNLENTVLYSAFNGQAAETHVVAGSYVGAGDPVTTVLLMDPMMVEIEVTAADSRGYRRGDVLALSVKNRHGTKHVLTGSVYSVDSVADPATRTFTVRLHVRNHKATAAMQADRTFAAKTKTISSINIGAMVGMDGHNLADADSIHEIDGRQFVWKVLNRKSDQPTTSDDRMLEVQRVEVRVVGEPVRFLGRWDYIPIEFIHPDEFDINRNLITGRLHFNDSVVNSDSRRQWSGGIVLLEDSQWMLRAGDVATVKLLSSNADEGFYVPMKAVREENGKAFVHVVDDSGAETTARRIRIQLPSGGAVASEPLLLKIESEESLLEDGMQIVVGGTHFLGDGDRIRIVNREEVRE